MPDAFIPARTFTLPALFISHGLPTLAINKNATTDALARLGLNLPQPRAIVIMSAHWQSEALEVSSALHLHTWHDYHLPDRLVEQVRWQPRPVQPTFSPYDPIKRLKNLTYAAKGHPELAQHIIDVLHTRGISAHADALHPLDHGVWSPLVHMYPQATIPIVQVSLPRYYDAYACYQLGAALHFLREQQILLIGSGNITHNTAVLQWQAAQATRTETADSPLTQHDTDTHRTAVHDAQSFRNWMVQRLQTDPVTALDWQHAPYAQKNHPTKEHLMPLFFALGAGQNMSVVHASFEQGTLGMDIYRFD